LLFLKRLECFNVYNIIIKISSLNLIFLSVLKKQMSNLLNITINLRLKLIVQKFNLIIVLLPCNCLTMREKLIVKNKCLTFNELLKYPFTENTNTGINKYNTVR